MTAPTEGVGVPTPTEAEARRRYTRGELDKVTPGGGQVKLQLRNEEGWTFWLNISSDQHAAIEKILLPEPASPVSHDPCIQGVIEIEGRKSEFLIPLVDDSVRYSQWGADNLTLWPRVDLLDGLAGAAREWALDNLRDDCPADCSPENEDTRDRPCTECGTDWTKYDGGSYDVFRRTQREERESND